MSYTKKAITVLAFLLYLLYLPALCFGFVAHLDGTIDIKRMDIEQMTYDLYCNPATKIFSPCPLSSVQIQLIESGATEIKIPEADSADYADEAGYSNYAGSESGCTVPSSGGTIDDMSTGMFRGYTGASGSQPACTQGGATASGDVRNYVYSVDSAASAKYARKTQSALSARVLNPNISVNASDIYNAGGDLNGDRKIDQNDVPSNSYVEWAGWVGYADMVSLHDNNIGCNDPTRPLYLSQDGTKILYYKSAGTIGENVQVYDTNSPLGQAVGCQNTPPTTNRSVTYPNGSPGNVTIAWANAAYVKRGTSTANYYAGNSDSGGNVVVDESSKTIEFNIGSDPYGRSLNQILDSTLSKTYTWKFDNYRCDFTLTNVPVCQGYAEKKDRILKATAKGGSLDGQTLKYYCSSSYGTTSFYPKRLFLNVVKKYYCFANSSGGTYTNTCDANYIGTDANGQEQYDTTECENKFNRLCASGSITYTTKSVTVNSPFTLKSARYSTVDSNAIISSICNLGSLPYGYDMKTSISIKYDCYDDYSLNQELCSTLIP
jgi:hypothetical protein